MGTRGFIIAAVFLFVALCAHGELSLPRGVDADIRAIQSVICPKIREAGKGIRPKRESRGEGEDLVPWDDPTIIIRNEEEAVNEFGGDYAMTHPDQNRAMRIYGEKYSDPRSRKKYMSGVRTVKVTFDLVPLKDPLNKYKKPVATAIANIYKELVLDYIGTHSYLGERLIYLGNMGTIERSLLGRDYFVYSDFKRVVLGFARMPTENNWKDLERFKDEINKMRDSVDRVFESIVRNLTDENGVKRLEEIAQSGRNEIDRNMRNWHVWGMELDSPDLAYLVSRVSRRIAASGRPIGVLTLEDVQKEIKLIRTELKNYTRFLEDPKATSTRAGLYISADEKKALKDSKILVQVPGTERWVLSRDAIRIFSVNPRDERLGDLHFLKLIGDNFKQVFNYRPSVETLALIRNIRNNLDVFSPPIYLDQRTNVNLAGTRSMVGSLDNEAMNDLNLFETLRALVESEGKSIQEVVRATRRAEGRATAAANQISKDAEAALKEAFHDRFETSHSGDDRGLKFFTIPWDEEFQNYANLISGRHRNGKRLAVRSVFMFTRPLRGKNIEDSTVRNQMLAKLEGVEKQVRKKLYNHENKEVLNGASIVLKYEPGFFGSSEKVGGGKVTLFMDGSGLSSDLKASIKKQFEVELSQLTDEPPYTVEIYQPPEEKLKQKKNPKKK